jgi:hypothetical protein
MRDSYLVNGILAIIASFGLSACGLLLPAKTSQTTQESSYRVAAMQTGKVVADLEIEQTPKSGTATDKAGFSVDELKSRAISNALSEHNGDVLLEPSFLVENNGLKVTVTVTGYVAKYVHLKQDQSAALNVSVSHPGGAVPDQPVEENVNAPAHRHEDVGAPAHRQEDVGAPAHRQEDAGAPAHRQEDVGAPAHRQEDAGVQPQKKKDDEVQPQKKKATKGQPQKKKKK